MAVSPIERLQKLSKEQSIINVKCQNNREITGRLQAVDKHFNLLLSEAIEKRTQPPCSHRGIKRKQEQVFHRDLGNLFLRGDTVIWVGLLPPSFDTNQPTSPSPTTPHPSPIPTQPVSQ
ncbi:small nuclear ribonucleoprotein D2 [Nematocida homosporus]|uniref:small nuclear ribonucleoprotein D2 n=1 Tax=Nematocida homosporus TaxID=1912981 RepID=UPI00221EA881|nr:small nuclear ribonucleoprotein D2 [Nematocida homosporus]KAI5185968.1 small nuclear ribonucleoprotein D2 [Nematocida homosporus]